MISRLRRMSSSTSARTPPTPSSPDFLEPGPSPDRDLDLGYYSLYSQGYHRRSSPFTPAPVETLAGLESGSRTSLLNFALLGNQPPKSPRRLFGSSSASAGKDVIPPIPHIPNHYRSNSSDSVAVASASAPSIVHMNPILGGGATVIRRPSEAVRGMKASGAVVSKSGGGGGGGDGQGHGHVPPVPKVQVHSPRESPRDDTVYPGGHLLPPSPESPALRARSSRTSLKNTAATVTQKPPPIIPLPPTPFSATLISCTPSSSSSSSSSIIVLNFAYSSAPSLDTTAVRLPLDLLQKAGGHLLHYLPDKVAELDVTVTAGDERTSTDGKLVRRPHIIRTAERREMGRNSIGSQERAPEMTDGESAPSEYDLDSSVGHDHGRGVRASGGSGGSGGSYDLDDLLQDEYLNSLIASPLTSSPPPPATESALTIQTTKTRTQVRNQYAQQEEFPSPSSPYTSRSTTTPLRIPNRSLRTRGKGRGKELTIRPPALVSPSGGCFELRILLLRDAAPYHLLAERLIMGSWSDDRRNMTQGLEAELRWLGMNRLAEEVSALAAGAGRRRSGAARGGQGYI